MLRSRSDPVANVVIGSLPIAETTANAARRNSSATRARTALIRGASRRRTSHAAVVAPVRTVSITSVPTSAPAITQDRRRGDPGHDRTDRPSAVLRLAREAGHEVGEPHRQQPDPDGDHATASRRSPCARRIAYRPPRIARCETGRDAHAHTLRDRGQRLVDQQSEQHVGVAGIHRRDELVTALQERVHGANQRRRVGPPVDPAGPEPARPLSPLLQITNHVDRLPCRPPRRTVLLERSPRRLVAQQLAGADPEPDIDLAEEGEPHDQRGIERRHEVPVEALELIADRRRERLGRRDPAVRQVQRAADRGQPSVAIRMTTRSDDVAKHRHDTARFPLRPRL